MRSPGFIGREWIETCVTAPISRLCAFLPALVVWSRLKQAQPMPQPAGCRLSPGFIGREWIETSVAPSVSGAITSSPGFIGREWIETPDSVYCSAQCKNSPGFIGREWIETLIEITAHGVSDSPGFIGREWIETSSSWLTNSGLTFLPALLVGSGLKRYLVGLRRT